MDGRLNLKIEPADYRQPAEPSQVTRHANRIGARGRETDHADAPLTIFACLVCACLYAHRGAYEGLRGRSRSRERICAVACSRSCVPVSVHMQVRMCIFICI